MKGTALYAFANNLSISPKFVENFKFSRMAGHDVDIPTDKRLNK